MIRKYFIWYFMFIKRLLHKTSFIILLCLIPVMLPIGNMTMTEESGVLKIAVCSEDGDETSQKVAEHLLQRESIVRFVEYKDNPEEAVKNGEVDAAWVFKSNLGERIDKYTSKTSSEPFVDVYEREDSIPLQISREVLYESLYESISYSLYGNFVRKELVPEISEEKLSDFYNSERLRDIIEIKRLNSDAPVKKVNYLTAPLRGFLSILVILCAMAAAMYFLEDNRSGKYDWLPREKRLAPAFASCFSATTLSGAAVFAAMLISGIATDIIKELVLIIMFSVSAAGFAMLLCVIFRSPVKLGACIPGIIIVMIVLSPIFFNLQVLKPLRLILPTHYYLYSVNDTNYLLYMAIYTLIMYAAVFIMNTLFGKLKTKQSIM